MPPVRTLVALVDDDDDDDELLIWSGLLFFLSGRAGVGVYKTGAAVAPQPNENSAFPAHHTNRNKLTPGCATS